MATFDGKVDNFHTLTTYDSQGTISECVRVIETWLSIGYKIDRCWIQKYGEGKLSHDIPVTISESGEVIVGGKSS
jgi:hypothetical protein